MLRGQGDSHMDASRWHELDDDWPSEEEALSHADKVARQYITTFADQA